MPGTACPTSATIGIEVMLVRTSLHHSIMGLTNKSPMRIKRPVNKQPSADQVLHRDWSPIAAVEAVITVVTHGEITVSRHRVRLIGFRKILLARRISAVWRSHRHHPLEPVT